MVFLTPIQDVSAASGILNIPMLEGLYRTFMDSALSPVFGFSRIITIHLPPQIIEDITTQASAPPQQYNPFFGRVPVPNNSTRNTGTRVTPRDVQYSAHIRRGPMSVSEDIQGIGELANDEAVITVEIGALSHLNDAISVSIEGIRFRIDELRPIGFSTRKYVMAKLKEIQESEPPSPDRTVG